jgi:hypothetical protein
MYKLIRTTKAQNTTLQSAGLLAESPCTSELGHVAPTGENRNAYTIAAGRTEGQRPPGIPRCKWGDNIKIYLKETMGGYRLD